MIKRKKIFEYDNYRTYLKDFYEASKALNKKFSFRYFAKEAGLKSPNSLQRVMEGDRSLTDEGVEKFIKALKLNPEESAFFRKLVLFNQAKSGEQKQIFAQEILRTTKFKKIHPLKESQYNYYAKWYYIVIRELVGLADFKEDPAWIAKKLLPGITQEEVHDTLESLQKLGLLVRTPEGRLSQTETAVSTPDEVTSASVAQYHREMSKKAAESIDRVIRDKREISSLTMGMSQNTAIKIKQMLRQYRQEIIDVVLQDQGADCVYQLNFHLFPLTEEGNES